MIVASVGVFDGVHSAHKQILDELKSMAKRRSLPSAVFTMVYPMEYYRKNFPGLLISPAERAQILQELVDEVYFLDLAEISDMSAEDFVRFLKKFGVIGLVVGDDFKFGKGGEGDVEFLRELCAELGIDVQVVRELRCNGERVSSSRIRKLVMKGNMKKAAQLLGRPFSISGKIYRDMGLGRKIGFPTANLDRGPEILVVPKSGVYFSKVSFLDRVMYGVTNIGTRPTIGGEDIIKYETHILDFNEDIYGVFMKVELLEYMRSEEKFSNLEELKAAISRDVKVAREMIAHVEKNS